MVTQHPPPTPTKHHPWMPAQTQDIVEAKLSTYLLWKWVVCAMCEGTRSWSWNSGGGCTPQHRSGGWCAQRQMTWTCHRGHWSCRRWLNHRAGRRPDSNRNTRCHRTATTIAATGGWAPALPTTCTCQIVAAFLPFRTLWRWWVHLYFLFEHGCHLSKAYSIITITVWQTAPLPQGTQACA